MEKEGKEEEFQTVVLGLIARYIFEVQLAHMVTGCISHPHQLYFSPMYTICISYLYQLYLSSIPVVFIIYTSCIYHLY